MMFVREGPYTGLICKFSLYVFSTFPLMAKPTIKILSPSSFEHPLLNKHDNKVTMSDFNAETDSLVTIIDFIRDLFVRDPPIKKDLSPESLINASVHAALYESNEKDYFTAPKWTPEVIECKQKILSDSWETRVEPEESVPPTEISSF